MCNLQLMKYSKRFKKKIIIKNVYDVINFSLVFYVFYVLCLQVLYDFVNAVISNICLNNIIINDTTGVH